MTWIRTVPPQQAEGTLKEAYEQVYALCPAEYRGEVPAVTPADGAADSIVASHSLIPDALLHSFSAFGVLLSPRLPLTRRQHELMLLIADRYQGHGDYDPHWWDELPRRPG